MTLQHFRWYQKKSCSFKQISATIVAYIYSVYVLSTFAGRETSKDEKSLNVTNIEKKRTYDYKHMPPVLSAVSFDVTKKILVGLKHVAPVSRQ